MTLPSALWKISVTTTTEAEAAVVELLSRVFDSAASAYTGAESRRTTVAVFCERPRPALEANRESLRTGLRQIKSCGLDLGPGRVRVQTIPREDWAESWKKHFKPLQIGDQLLIKPGWIRRRPRPGQAQVVLDPGLSFGTGRHPTTLFCLQQLVACRDRRLPQAFLDIGTGSGILVIAAAKLGYHPAHALDSDPLSVRVARANARRNRIESRVRIRRQDLRGLPAGQIEYDLICANLTGDLLLEERPRILGRLKPGGQLVLAGILMAQFAPLRAAYAAAGLELTRCRAEGGWQSALFRRIS